MYMCAHSGAYVMVAVCIQTISSKICYDKYSGVTVVHKTLLAHVYVSVSACELCVHIIVHIVS